MKRFTIYNSEGEILRSGFCTTASFDKKAGDGEFVIEGTGNDVTQKVVNLDQYGTKPIGFLKIVNKTPEEMIGIKILVSKVTPYEKQPAQITNEQWQDVLKRIDELEKL